MSGKQEGRVRRRDFLGKHWDRREFLGGLPRAGTAWLLGLGAEPVGAELKGKTVALAGLGAGSTQHVYLALMAAYVGLDPGKDINWVTHPFPESARLLAQGKVDAFLGFPPEPQELRARKIGHVVVNSAVDRPWSEYFCCVVVANREFVRKHHVAAKRSLRAILKAHTYARSSRTEPLESWGTRATRRLTSTPSRP